MGKRRSSVFAGNHVRRVVEDVLQLSQGLTKPSESACCCVLAPSPVRIKRPEVTLWEETTTDLSTL